MRRSIITLGTIAGLALGGVAVPVLAGPVTPAAAASTCHGPTTPYNFFSDGGGYWYAPAAASGDEVYDNSTHKSTWCQVVGQDSSGIQYTLFRLKDTSLCAQYYGPAAGAGEVKLAGCDTSTAEQNWTYQDYEIMSEYQVNNVGIAACLSSYANEAQSALVIVDPSSTGGCNGIGGQSWDGF
jgi:hypothetical protein